MVSLLRFRILKLGFDAEEPFLERNGSIAAFVLPTRVCWRFSLLFSAAISDFSFFVVGTSSLRFSVSFSAKKRFPGCLCINSIAAKFNQACVLPIRLCLIRNVDPKTESVLSLPSLYRSSFFKTFLCALKIPPQSRIPHHTDPSTPHSYRTVPPTLSLFFFSSPFSSVFPSRFANASFRLFSRSSSVKNFKSPSASAPASSGP